jgi:hypothetical protein
MWGSTDSRQKRWQDHILRHKLMLQEFLHHLKSAFCKFYGLYSDLVCKNNLALNRMLSDEFYSIRYAVLTYYFDYGLLHYLIWKLGNPVSLISTIGWRRLWPVSRECLFLHDICPSIVVSSCRDSIHQTFYISLIVITFKRLSTSSINISVLPLAYLYYAFEK